MSYWVIKLFQILLLLCDTPRLSMVFTCTPSRCKEVGSLLHCRFRSTRRRRRKSTFSRIRWWWDSMFTISWAFWGANLNCSILVQFGKCWLLRCQWGSQGRRQPICFASDCFTHLEQQRYDLTNIDSQPPIISTAPLVSVAGIIVAGEVTSSQVWSSYCSHLVRNEDICTIGDMIMVYH